MKWVVGAGFDWTNTAPAEMILARHVEILRADATLLTLFGGVAENPLLIRCCPFATDKNSLELASVPALFATLPSTDRQPIPGANRETVTVRDVIRFHSEGVGSEEPIWEPGLLSVVSHLIGVVQTYQQLKLTTPPSPATIPYPIQLAERVDLEATSLEQIESPQEGSARNVWDLSIDFKYSITVNAKTIPARLWNLVTAGA